MVIRTIENEFLVIISSIAWSRQIKIERKKKIKVKSDVSVRCHKKEINVVGKLLPMSLVSIYKVYAFIYSSMLLLKTKYIKKIYKANSFYFMYINKRGM